MVARALAWRHDLDRFTDEVIAGMRWWFLGMPPAIGWGTLRACIGARRGVASAGNAPAMRAGATDAARIVALYCPGATWMSVPRVYEAKPGKPVPTDGAAATLGLIALASRRRRDIARGRCVRVIVSVGHAGPLKRHRGTPRWHRACRAYRWPAGDAGRLGRPVKIHVHPPDGGVAEEVALADGAAIVVGRDPDPAALGTPGRARGVVVASPLVSSNHVGVWREGDRLHARDLQSKNGTYLRLEPGIDASLDGPCDAHLFLSAPRAPSRHGGPAPVAVADVEPAAFASRVRDAIAAWLAQHGAHPDVTVAPDTARDGRDDDDHDFRLPLIDGLVIVLADRDGDHTQIRWDALKAELYPYAYEQSAAYRACRAARVRRPLAYASPAAERVLRAVLEAARSRLPLVLLGESGTGKTELAAIYGGREGLRPASRRGLADGPPLVTVHCAHLDPALAHSTLFGALKGSYTSAHRTIVGAVELADGGTLFLDDVDALPLETQAKLLRFFDVGEYEPLGHGERTPMVASVRVVTGTNADLRAAVRERRFREDLYWRLHSGAVVRVPPLRERPEDIEQLLQESHDGQVGARLDSGAREYLLRRHVWRGNFRECLRFCARVAMEPPGPPLDRRRCEAILAETAIEPEALAPTEEVNGPSPAAAADSAFERALGEAVAWWIQAAGRPPVRFDELQHFCEGYLKSVFVAHTLGVADQAERPDAFDRAGRQRLGCDLSTIKRKVDEYLALRAARSTGKQ